MPFMIRVPELNAMLNTSPRQALWNIHMRGEQVQLHCGDSRSGITILEHLGVEQMFCGCCRVAKDARRRRSIER